MRKLLLPAFSAFFISFIFLACDVGLGEAVDTEKPTVSIEYPQNGAIIKEDFVVSGKCADDSGIKSVKLLLTDSSKNEYSFDAVLGEDKKSWSVKINEFDSENRRYPLVDCDYSVTVTATDTAGRKSEEDKSNLRIDNIPPLVVFQNPATSTETPLNEAGGFGASMKIEGYITDDSVTNADSGSKFVFTVFDENDSYLARREVSNIPPSLGIVVGEYSESETAELSDSNKFYKAIYGDVGDVFDTRYRKFKATVSDSARTYKGADVASDSSERGNISDCYYLYEEIYTDVISKINEDNTKGNAYKYLYSLITKRAENRETLTEDEKNILSTLEKFKHESDDEYEDSSDSALRAAVSRTLSLAPVGTFSLNPLNNPSFEITSFDAFDSSVESSSKRWEGRSVSTSGNITIIAKVGLSNVPLDKSSFKVVVYKTDENGARLESTAAEPNNDVEVPCEWTQNGSNYTGRLTLSTKYVEVAQFYGIELKGQDKSNVGFYNGTTEYRFLVQSGTTPPDVKITGYSAPNSGTTVYLKKKNSSTEAASTEAVDLVISGTAESRSGSAKGYVVLYPNVNQKDYFDNKVTTTSNTENGWSLTIPGSVFNDEKSDSYSVTIYATDEITNQTSKEVSVIFDKEDPKVQVNSVNNVVVFDSDTEIKAGGQEFTATANRGYVNGKITVAGNVSDNDAFKSGAWKASCGGTEIAGGNFTTSQFRFEIDTTKGTDGENLDISIEAYDRAGNKTSYSYKYDDGNPLVIHQITDYPVVKLSNADFNILTDDGIKVGENLFDQTGNNKLSGSVTDDDGIETIDIKYAEVSDNGEAGEFKSLLKNPINAGKKTSYSLNQELKDASSGKVLAEGSYRIKIVAKDINGKSLELTPFAICISNSAPAITFRDPVKGSSDYKKETFTAKGTVSGQFKFEGDSSKAILKRGTKEITVTKNADGTYSWEDYISDISYEKGIGTPDKDSGITTENGTDFEISYTVTDKFGRTTTDSVPFKTDFVPPTMEFTQVSPLVTGYSGTPSVYANGAVNGTITIQGTSSDTDKVVSTVLKIYKAKEVKDEAGKVIKFEGKAGEAIQSLSYDGTSSKVGEAIKTIESVTNTANNFKFEVDTKNLEENFDNAGIILQLESTDRAGNTGTTDYPVYVCQKTDEPVLSFGNGDVNCTDETKITVGNNLFGMGSDILYINVTDDDGVQSVKYTADGVTLENDGNLLTDGKSTTFSGQINISKLKEGVHSLRFTVTDIHKLSKSFPETESSSIKVAYDNDVPEISVSTINTVSYSENMWIPKNSTVNGTVSDSSGVKGVYLATDNEQKSNLLLSSDNNKWLYTSLEDKDGENYTKSFVAVDKFGRPSSVSIKYSIDTVSPVFINIPDSTSEDEKIIIAASAQKANTSELGKKWFNQTAVTISGTVKEEHLDTLYLVASGNETSFTASSSGEKSKFKVTSEFVEGPNSFSLKAKDKAGNESSIGPFSVNIDKTPPAINSVSIEGVPESGVVNSNSKLSVKFAVTDKYVSSTGEEIDGSGIAEVIVSDSSSFVNKLGNWKLHSDSSVDETVPEELELSTENLEPKTYQLWIRVIDKAGNTSDKEISSFTYDNKAPVVEITSPSKGSVVNKEIELKGTVIETNLDTSSVPVLWMYGNSGWENISDKYVTSASIDSIGTTWTIKLDTEKISNTATNVEKAFFVQITDKAGNVNALPSDNSSAYKLKINQDSDRPVVYITNISLSGMTSSNPVWHKQNTITGIVSDDDGSVKELYVSETENLLEKTSASENLFKNGSWTYKFEENGSKDLYFKVVDSKGATFISKVVSDLNSPKIQDSSSLLFGEYGKDSVVHIKVDTKEPTIPVVRYTTINPSADLEGDKARTNAESILASDFSNWTVKEKGWKDINFISADVFGGNYSKLYMLVKATDENGISSLKGFLKSSIASEASFSGSVGAVNLSSNPETDDIRLIEFDISKLTSGTKTLSIVAKDKASESDVSAVGTTREFSVAVDNSAPEVKFNSHTDGASVYGSESVTIRGETSDSHSIVNLYFALSKSKDEEPKDEDWFSVYDNTSVFLWNILFDGNSNSGDSAHHAKKLNDYINDLYGEVGGKKYADIYDNVPICIWAYAVDEYNNSGKTNPVSLPLTVVTQGDKPTIDITYPENEQTVGGTITITGSTKIATNSVSAVYVQIDPDYDETVGFSKNWKNKLQSIIDSTTVDYEIVETNNEVIGSAVKANGSVQSWNLIINAAKEFNKKDSDGKDANRKIAVRCYALSVSGKVSEPSTVSFILDPGSPVFGSKKPLRLVQYNDDGTENASQMYESGMWIKGIWYLTGSVEDDSGIKSLKLDGKEILNSDNVKEDETVGDYKNYILNIPLGNESGYGNISYKLEAFEGSSDNKSTAQEININYDNQSPDFKSTTLSETETNKIFQSDGVYEIKGSFLEDGAGGNQSGFNRIAFYFTRTLDDKTYIIDPMLQKGTDGKQNRYDVATETGLEKDKDGLYWRKVESCKVVNGNEISLSELPSNVRVGGLCKVNNIVYRIKTISDKTVTVGSKITNSDSVIAYFAVAQVIDNTIKETGKTTYYGDSEGSSQIINDDGDGMVESYSESSGEWTVSINTHNIFDGPINIHFVAFDKAGNMTTAEYSGIVSNNTPRIAGIILGTDLNGNGKVDDSEFIKSYSGLYNIDSSNKIAGVSVNGKKANGENVTSLDISDDGKAVMTIKGTSKFIPEIVGGNTSLGWSYSVNGVEKHSYTEFAGTQHSDSNDVRDSSTTTIELTMLDFLKDSVEDGTNQNFKFSIWDKTEGFTAGTDSQHADFNIVMNVAIKDEVPPEVYIKPFYWNGSSENSIFADSDGTLKGHIELEEDWKQTDSYKNSGNPASSGEYDADPKVSGIIYIEGNASDNVILQKLEMLFPGLNGNTDYITVAERNNGEWDLKGSLETDGFKFEIKGDGELFDNVEGNTLDYRIAVDTSKITTIAATDVNVKMRATDRGSVKLNVAGTGVEYGTGNNSADAQEVTSTENPTSLYRMDIVPYITGVTTYLSKKLKTSIVDAYTRTALGHYIISNRESSIELEGFNLGKNNTVDATASGFTSGEYVVSVNDVESLNNKNNNNACGSYKNTITEDSTYEQKANYAYNRQPVEKSNHLLTDDIYFDVWEFDSDAAIPMSGKLSEPVMKINPSNGKIGFAFVSGPADFSMADGIGRSYKNYQKNYATFSNISMAFDDDGYSYGTATGLDTYPSGATDTQSGRFTFMTSRWGTDADSMDDNYNYENKLRLEAIGLPGSEKCYVKGTYPSTYTMTETRFSSPSLAVASHGTATSVYLAYYDDVQFQIRFRFGSECPDSKKDFDNFVDNEGLGDVSSQKLSNNNNNRKYVFEANTSKFSLIAGVDWQNYSTSEDTSTGKTYKVDNNYFYDTGYAAGQFVAIDVIPGSSASTDIVIAVWYDGSDCWYGYNTDPKSGKDNGVDGGWKCQKIFSDGGEYCTVKAGPDGSVHIAANVDGSLCYAYLSKYDAEYDEATNSVIVDSFTITGEQINIDVGRREVMKADGFSQYYVIPYISYYVSAAKMPAVASLVIPVSGDMDYTMQGAVNDVFTGGWEVSLVPTDSTMSGGANDKVNIGLWKKTLNNMKGVIVKSTELNTKTSSSNSSTASYGDCYGNGTDNAVLGYAVKTSSGTAIETAQLK